MIAYGALALTLSIFLLSSSQWSQAMRHARAALRPRIAPRACANRRSPVSYEQIVARVLPDIEYHQNRYARELASAVTEGCCWLDVGTGKRLHWGWLGDSAAEL